MILIFLIISTLYQNVCMYLFKATKSLCWTESFLLHPFLFLYWLEDHCTEFLSALTSLSCLPKFVSLVFEYEKTFLREKFPKTLGSYCFIQFHPVSWMKMEFSYMDCWILNCDHYLKLKGNLVINRWAETFIP